MDIPINNGQQIVAAESRKYLRPGFSLIEFLIYFGIVAGLIAMIGVAYNKISDVMATNKNKTILLELNTSIERFRADTGQIPTTLKDLVTKPQGDQFSGWDGPYLAKGLIPKNPWNGSYNYKPTPEGKHEYDITTKTGRGNTLSVWDL